MKKLILLGLVIWLSLNAFAKSVQADTKTESIVGHVITQTIQGNDGNSITKYAKYIR